MSTSDYLIESDNSIDSSNTSNTTNTTNKNKINTSSSSLKINIYSKEYINNNPNNFIINNDNNDTDNIIDEDDTHFFRGSSNNPDFTTYHSLTKNNDKNIREELEKLNLHLDIINMADSVFQKMQTGTRRGRKRKLLIYHCVRTAYDELGIPRDPKELADVCGIEYSEITKASSMCSPVQTNYSSPIIVYSPIQFIPNVFKRLEEAIESQVQFPEGTLEQILDIAREVISDDDNDEAKQNPLLGEKPQMVAAAIILYYIEMHGIMLDRKIYKPLFNTTYSTINKLRLQVDAAYNK